MEQSEELSKKELIISHIKYLLPIIKEQMNNTAKTFFYDRRKCNRILRSQGLPLIKKRGYYLQNVIVGDNEIGGVCQDYAFHFVHNYNGPGQAYVVSVSVDGEAELIRLVKPFEKSDIINDSESADLLRENIYKMVISDRSKNTARRWEDDYEKWRPFYTKRINKTVYWSEKSFDSKTPLVPFRKDDHIIIHEENFKKAKEVFIDNFYNYILQNQKDMGEFRVISVNMEDPNLHLGKISVSLSAKNEKLFLVEEKSIPTPKSHAGHTVIEDFSDHAWVRIIWDEVTIDVEPTWYDGGLLFKQAVEVIQ